MHGAAIRVSATEAQQLQNIPCSAVLLQADGDNTGNIYVGGIGAAAANPGRDYKLYPGGEHVFPVRNTNLLTVIGDFEGDLLRYHIYRNYTYEPSIDYTAPPYIDYIPPTVVSTFPVNTTAAAEINTEIYAIFSEEIDPVSVTATSVTINPNVAHTVYRDSVNPNKIILKPSADLTNSISYNVIWTTELKDLSGNAMASNYGIIFTTAALPPPVDATPPIVESTSIADGATNVPISTNTIYGVCSEDIGLATVVAGSVLISPAVNKVVSRDPIDFKKVILTLTQSLSYSTLYTVTFTSTLEDLAGNALSPIKQIAFTTEAEVIPPPPPPPPDTTPPVLISESPANGATGVSITVPNIYAIFSENILPSTITNANVTVSPSITKTVAADPLDPKKIIVTPSSSLTNSVQYNVTYTTGFKDMAGNSLAQNQSRLFTTAAPPPDITPPTLDTVSPTDGAVDVSVSVPNIYAIFSEDINEDTVDNTTVTMNPNVARTASVDIANAKRINVVPSVALANNTLHTVTYTAGIEDLAGNALAGAPLAKTFTTIAAPDVTPPTIASNSPINNATGVQPSAQITITFDEEIQASTATLANNSKLVKTENSGVITCTRQLSVDQKTITVTPSTSLEFSKQYTVTVNAAAVGSKIKDLIGNIMAGTPSFSFTTRPLQETIIYNISNNGSTYNMGRDQTSTYLGTKVHNTSHPLYNKIPHKVVVRGRCVGSPSHSWYRLAVIMDPNNYDWSSFEDDHAGWIAANVSTGYARQIGGEMFVADLPTSGSAQVTFEDATQTEPLQVGHYLMLIYFEGDGNDYLKIMYNSTNAISTAYLYSGENNYSAGDDFAALIYENS